MIQRYIKVGSAHFFKQNSVADDEYILQNTVLGTSESITQSEAYTLLNIADEVATPKNPHQMSICIMRFGKLEFELIKGRTKTI